MHIEARFRVGDRVLVTLPRAFRSHFAFQRSLATVVREPLMKTLTDAEYLVRYDGDHANWPVWDSWMTRTVTQEIVDVCRAKR